MTDDVLTMSAADLVARYRAKTLSPVEVTTAALERIGRLNPIYNAFVLVDPERALADARASERRWQAGAPAGSIDGVPATVKDLVVVKGWPTRRGSHTTDPAPSSEDGPPVARMRALGAVFLGKTTTCEFGWKGVTDSPLTGVTRNPWNPDLTSGGSSGGAAVAAALGMGTLHLATDGGGSIRIPAGFSGVFGFKPTFGVASIHPHSPALTLWHQGPITRTVSDAARMLTAMAGPDVRDFYALPDRPIDYTEGLNRGVAGLRIAYSRTLGYARVDPDVARLVGAAVLVLARLGAQVEEIDLALDDPITIMQPLWSVALAVGVAPMTATQRAMVDPPLLDLVEPGLHMSALDYRRLEREREAFARRFALLHQTYDLLVTPQLATTAFAVNHEVPPASVLTHWWEWSPFTYPFNLTQQPAAAVPCGIGDAGLPVAMQIVGAKFADALVLQAARAFEAAQPFRLPPIPGKAL
jgi:aspartyl-tRNA(Asn)/glutamyl-tRNA(Gln) amidotransferase subunit A